MGLWNTLPPQKLPLFCIVNTKTSMYQVISIHKLFTSLGASHITP